jgi:hypothetical protein
LAGARVSMLSLALEKAQMDAVADPSLGTDVLILKNASFGGALSASRKRPSICHFFIRRTEPAGVGSRYGTLPEPQFLDRPPPHSTLEGDHFHPTPCDDAAAVPHQQHARPRLTRRTNNSRDPRRCSPDAAVPDLGGFSGKGTPRRGPEGMNEFPFAFVSLFLVRQDIRYRRRPPRRRGKWAK